MKPLRCAGLYWRTARHLRFRQLAWQLLRRIQPQPRVSAPHDTPCVRGTALQVEFAGAAGNHTGPGDAWTFRFIGIEQRFDDGSVDWSCPGLPRLWRYNLHYFDWMLDARRDHGDIGAIIRDWMARNPPGTADAWDPYTLSLRTVNWIKYALTRPGASITVDGAWLRSLWHQGAWLRRRLEYHILANHLLKNIKALLFLGSYFEGPDADEWLHHGARLLKQQLDEQFLPDGGHFERSPMYHALATEDLLDLLELGRACPGRLAPDIESLLAAKADGAVSFLARMLHPDGGIALFNDSAHGIAVPAPALSAYAARLLGPQAMLQRPEDAVVRLSDSGYFGWQGARDSWLIDCGPVSSDYQPGHAHCDLLSYELSFDGRRIVVDTGVHDYERGEKRARARRTSSHNTVTVDGAEQSEMWDVFRVGRRAHARAARLSEQADGLTFEGSHDGYSHLAGGITHRRCARYSKGGILSIMDELTGDGSHSMDGYIHLAPGLQAVLDGNTVTVATFAGRDVASVTVEPGSTVTLEPDEHYPEFGRAEPTTLIRLHRRGTLPLRQGYAVSRL